MAVDPVDDCTFWYTQEYYATNGGTWRTRVGSFKFPNCVVGTPTPTPTISPGNNPDAGSNADPDTDADTIAIAVYADVHENDRHGWATGCSGNRNGPGQQLRRLLEYDRAAVHVQLLRAAVHIGEWYLERQPAVQQHRHVIHQ